MNTVGEPDEGKPHVRFDEGRLGRLPLNQSPTLPATQVEKAHGRIEKRVVQTSTALNDYLDFPHVHQVFRIERSVTMVRSGGTKSPLA